MEPTLERSAPSGRLRLRAGTKSPSTSRWTCCFTATRRCRSIRTACASRRSDAAGNVLHREEFYLDRRRFHRARCGVRQGTPTPAGRACRILRVRRRDCCEWHGTTASSCTNWCLQNERAFRPEAQTRAALLHIWSVMHDCIERGFARARACCRACSRCAGARAHAPDADRIGRNTARSRDGLGRTRMRSPSTKRMPRVAGSSPRRPTARRGSFRP